MKLRVERIVALKAVVNGFTSVTELDHATTISSILQTKAAAAKLSTPPSSHGLTYNWHAKLQVQAKSPHPSFSHLQTEVRLPSETPTLCPFLPPQTI